LIVDCWLLITNS